jgi:hypothetical protein
MTRIVDEISFHEKDDSFLLQVADACAFLLRIAFEGREDCGVFYDAFTDHNRRFLNLLAQKARANPVGGNIVQFEEFIAE